MVLFHIYIYIHTYIHTYNLLIWGTQFCSQFWYINIFCTLKLCMVLFNIWFFRIFFCDFVLDVEGSLDWDDGGDGDIFIHFCLVVGWDLFWIAVDIGVIRMSFALVFKSESILGITRQIGDLCDCSITVFISIGDLKFFRRYF